MEGYMDGYMDGWMDGWMDGKENVHWEELVTGKPARSLLIRVVVVEL